MADDLLGKINKKLTEAIKGKNQVAIDTLRMVKAALKEKEIELRRKLKEEEVLGVLRSQVKSREDSIGQFREAGRDDLSEREEKEIEVVREFLPRELKPEELRRIIKEAIRETGAQNKSDLGKVMPLSVRKAKGRASGKAIKDLVLEMLP